MITASDSTRNTLQLPEYIINNYAKLVWFIAYKIYRKFPLNGSYDVDDLYQEGIIGLIHAWHRVDENQKEKFSPFATNHIYGRMYNYIFKNFSQVRQDKSTDQRKRFWEERYRKDS